jgi:hypothetical protein
MPAEPSLDLGGDIRAALAADRTGQADHPLSPTIGPLQFVASQRSHGIEDQRPPDRSTERRGLHR